MKIKKKNKSQSQESLDVVLVSNDLDQKPSLAHLAEKHGIRKGPGRPRRKPQRLQQRSISPKTERRQGRGGSGVMKSVDTLAKKPSARQGRIHACEICNEVFMTNINLVHHKYGAHRMSSKRRSGSDKLQADQTSRPAREAKGSDVQKKLRSKPAGYPCEVCDKVFGRSSNLMQHKKRLCHHSIVPNAAGVQEDPPSNATSTAKPRRGVGRPAGRTCQVCRQMFNEEVALVQHKRDVPKRGHVSNATLTAKPRRGVGRPVGRTCKECLEVFKEEAALIQHKRDVHKRDSVSKPSLPSKKAAIVVRRGRGRQPGKPGHACEVCHKVFKLKAKFIQHKRRAHKPKYVKIAQTLQEVPVPTSKPARAKKVITPRQIKVEDKVYPCDECSEEFKDHMSMIQHRGRAHHLNESPEAEKVEEDPPKPMPDANATNKPFLQRNGAVWRKAFKCEHCGDVFIIRLALIKHIQERHQVKIAKKMTAAANTVLVNVKRCLADCKLCGMKFDKLSTLMEHKMELHDKYGPFVCFGCDDVFLSLIEMKTHERICSLHKSRFHSNRDPIDDFWRKYTSAFRE